MPEQKHNIGKTSITFISNVNSQIYVVAIKPTIKSKIICKVNRRNHANCFEKLQYRKNVLSFGRKQFTVISIFLNIGKLSNVFGITCKCTIRYISLTNIFQNDWRNKKFRRFCGVFLSYRAKLKRRIERNNVFRVTSFAM